MSQIETYDAREVTVIIAGRIITGFAEGSMVKVDPNGDIFTPYVGAQGEVARSRNADRSGKIAVSLKQTSPSNDFFVQLSKSNDTFATSITDNLNKKVAGGVDCWVQKKSGIEYKEKLGEREWEIFVPELELD